MVTSLQPSISTTDAYALLRLQHDFGIDEAVSNAPDSWPLHQAKAPSPAPATPSTTAPTARGAAAPAPSLSLSKEIEKARALADGANTLAELEAAIRNFDGCALKRTATHTVFARGNPQSRIMLIGEAPSAEDDKTGVPFCGSGGQLLDTMLGYISLNSPDDFYITNTLFWRPPGNRQPTPEEIAVCKPFVEKHISIINPKLMVLVGGVSTKALLERDEGITRLRSKRFEYTNPYIKEAVPTRAMFHPSYLLRQPLAKRDAWSDLLVIRSELNQ